VAKLTAAGQTSGADKLHGELADALAQTSAAFDGLLSRV
jgi:hypothetical protein